MRTISLIILCLFALPLTAKEELVTLPDRDGVQLTIYNSVDLTFVREKRTLSFKQGDNQLQFSWANTLIDPTSVDFLPMDQNSGLAITTTSYPKESGEMLIWTVAAERAGDFQVSISYFTSGISWSADYVAVMTPKGDSMSLTGTVTVVNRSGEEYEKAQVRLIIGHIRLVEKIYDLAMEARRQGQPDLAKGYARRARAKLAEELEDMDESAMAPEDSASNAPPRPKEVAKEKIGEYFMYTIEGTETIPNGWAKRLVAVKTVEVSTAQVYYYKPKDFGSQLVRVLEFKNDEEHNLGTDPLPGGTVKFYGDQSEGHLSYIASVMVKYLPVGDEAKWNLGVDPRVTMKVTTMRVKKENLSFTGFGRNRRLTGYDVEKVEQIEVHNYRDVAVEFEIHLRYRHNKYDWQDRAGGVLEDAFTTKWRFGLDGGAERKIDYRVVFYEGTNKENR